MLDAKISCRINLKQPISPDTDDGHHGQTSVSDLRIPWQSTVFSVIVGTRLRPCGCGASIPNAIKRRSRDIYQGLSCSMSLWWDEKTWKLLKNIPWASCSLEFSVWCLALHKLSCFIVHSSQDLQITPSSTPTKHVGNTSAQGAISSSSPPDQRWAFHPSNREGPRSHTSMFQK